MKIKKILAGLLAAILAASATGCATTPSTSTSKANTSKEDTTSAAGTEAEAKNPHHDRDTVELTVFSQLANFSGVQPGWFGEVMKQKFNVTLKIVPDTDGAFDTRMESGNLGDIVVFGSVGDQYQRAVREGLILDWNEDNMLDEYAPYIKEHMATAINYNANLNGQIIATEGMSKEEIKALTFEEKQKMGEENKVVHGFGHNVATSSEDFSAFMYTWDIRWDLYKELGYPEVKNLDDLKQLFIDMKKIAPKDDNGKETYALSMWPDWDGNMVMYAKAFATAYWGYDEMGFGLYDVENGKFLEATDPNGPYYKSLKFLNELNQAGLIDPNSMSQKYTQMEEKVLASGVFFSIFNYAGQEMYNSADKAAEGKYMYSMVPTDARPIAYGMKVQGDNRVWTVGNNTEYPELCLEIINWLATPEGYMTYLYGPKDVMWGYDENGNSFLTELGKKAKQERSTTMMSEEWGGGTFNDGTFQANNPTWNLDATNPDSNDETYRADNWKSFRTGATSEIQKDWMDKMNAYDAQEYLKNRGKENFVIAPGSTYAEAGQSSELKIIWKQVAEEIKQRSWQAIYAKTDAEFEAKFKEMQDNVKSYDPEGLCMAWGHAEAASRKAHEDALKS